MDSSVPVPRRNYMLRQNFDFQATSASQSRLPTPQHNNQYIMFILRTLDHYRSMPEKNQS